MKTTGMIKNKLIALLMGCVLALSIYSPGISLAQTGTAPKPVVSLAVKDANAGEPNNNAEFIVSANFSGTRVEKISVNMSISGTATNGTDYETLVVSQVTLADVVLGAGTLREKAFTVIPIDDSLVEGTETIVVTLLKSSEYEIGLPRSSEVTINLADNDFPPLTITPSSAQLKVNETLKFSASGGEPPYFWSVSDSNLAKIADDGTLTALGTGTVNVSVFDQRQSQARSENIEISLPNPRVEVTASDTNAAEPSDPGEFTFTLDRAPGGNGLTVSYTVTGTATEGSDYAELNSSVTFGPNDTRKTLTVSPVADSDFNEGTETIILALAESRNYSLGNASRATINLSDAKPPLPVVSLSASDANAAEPSDPGEFTFTLDRAPGPNGLTVNYTLSGTATQGSDYTSLTGTIAFTPDDTRKTLAIAPIADTDFNEGNETIILTLNESQSYTLGASTRATVNLVDAIEAPPVITLIPTDSDLAEPNNTGSFTVQLDRALQTRTLTVSLDIKGNAVSDKDYQAIPSTLNFAIGESQKTVVITPIDNTTYEGNSRIIDIAIPSHQSYVLGTESRIRLTLLDNETPPFPVVNLSSLREEVSETDNDSVIYTITSTARFNDPTNINFRVASTSTATLPDDGQLSISTKTITIDEGEDTVTFSFKVNNDSLYEAHEVLAIELLAGNGYVLGQNVNHLLRILDDDKPTIAITASNNTTTEAGSETGKFTVELSAPVIRDDIAVNYSLSGTASAPQGNNQADYSLNNQILIIPVGEQRAVIEVTALADNETEPDESVTLTLEPSELYQLGNTQQATVTIVDAAPPQNLPTLTINALDAIAAEPQSSAAVLVTSNQIAGPTGITAYIAISGTASDSDIEAIGNTVFIAAGETTATVLVKPIPDQLVESDESVIISLSHNDAYLVAANNQATVIIKDDGTQNSNVVNAPSNNDTVPIIRIELINGLTAGNLRPQTTIDYLIRVIDQTNTPVANADITWELNQEALTAGASITPANNQSSASGEAQASLTAANYAVVHILTIRASVLDNQNNPIIISERFSLTTGLATLFSGNSPEATMASLMDAACHNLNTASALNDQQALLLQNCDQYYAALSSQEDAALRTALQQLHPNYVPTLGKVSSRLMHNQLENIAQHLRTSRQRRTASSFTDAVAGLSVNINGEPLPLHALIAASNSATGGGAGSDDALWFDERLGFFVSGKILSGEQSDYSTERGADFDTEGLTFGLDYRLSPTSLIGGAFGFSKTEADFTNQSGKLDSSGYSLSLFGSHYFNDELYFDAAFNLGQTDHSTQRTIAYTLNGTNTQLTPKGKTDDNQIGILFNIGYSLLPSDSSISLDLFSQTTYTRIRLDGYNEEGANALNFTINDHDFSSLNFAFGAHLTKAFNQAWGVLVPQVNLSWNKHMLDAYTIRGRLVNDPGNTHFEFQTEKEHESYFRLNAGISTQFANGLSGFVDYTTLVQSDSYTERGFNFGLRFYRVW